jgi:protoporphyrinogen/coproporphyrinogen III oxidase
LPGQDRRRGRDRPGAYSRSGSERRESTSVLAGGPLYDRRVESRRLAAGPRLSRRAATSTSPRHPSDVDVLVVGGGLAGLAAAWHLRDLDVLVLEAEETLGGRIRSKSRGDLWLNFGAHVFGSPGSAAGRLIAATGVEAVQVPGRLAAVALGGRVLAGGMVETYPFRLPLSLRSRLALIRAGTKLRLAVRRYAAVAAERPGEAPAGRQQRMLDFLDDRSFSEFIGPLPRDVDSIFRATLNRSSGEPEELAAGYGIGYFHLVWNRSGGL